MIIKKKTMSKKIIIRIATISDVRGLLPLMEQLGTRKTHKILKNVLKYL
jgi:hypothetical protein